MCLAEARILSNLVARCVFGRDVSHYARNLPFSVRILAFLKHAVKNTQSAEHAHQKADRFEEYFAFSKRTQAKTQTAGFGIAGSGAGSRRRSRKAERAERAEHADLTIRGENSSCQRSGCSVILDIRKKYIKRLCSSGKPQPKKAAELPEAKMEAGEIPARSRHCKGGAFFSRPLRMTGHTAGTETLGRRKNVQMPESGDMHR